MAVSLGGFNRDPGRIVSELGELADAAALDPQHWGAFFQGIQDLVPGGRIAFQAHDEAAPTPIPMVAIGWEDQTLDAYAQHFAAINPWVPSWIKIPSMVSVRSDWHLQLAELQRTEFYNDWLRPIGEADFATGMKLVHERGRLAQFAIQYDAKRAEQLHAPLSIVLDKLAPRLRRALDCNRVALRGKANARGAGLMDALYDPVFLISSDRRLIEANDAGSKLLHENAPFRIVGDGIVSGSDHQTDQQFVKIVQKACSRLIGSMGSSEFVYDRPDIRLSIAALPVAPNLRSMALKGPLPLFAPGVMALVVVRQLPSQSADVSFALRKEFQLTVSEARVALALSGGGSMVEIADRLGLQYGTARAHLKAAFAKTKTHNQRELLALIVRLEGADAQ